MFSLNERERNPEEEKLDLLQQSADYLSHTKKLIDYGEYDLASCLLENFLRKNPSHPLALRLASFCFKALDESGRFLSLLKSLMKMSLLTMKKAILYADVLRECGWDKEAKNLYLKCLISKLKGQKNIQKKEEEENEKFSIQDFYLQEENPSEMSSTQNSLAFSSKIKPLKNKNQNKSQKTFFTLYKNLGDLSLKLNTLEEAERYYSQAFRINPRSDDLWVSYGTLEMKKGQLQEALLYYRKAAEANSENEMAWLGLAIVHREYRDKELAWGNLEKALDVNIMCELALSLATRWADQDGKQNTFIRILQDSKAFQRKEEESVKIHFLLAKILYALGRYQHALEEMRALQKKGSDCKGLLGMQFVLKEALKTQNQYFLSSFVEPHASVSFNKGERVENFNQFQK